MNIVNKFINPDYLKFYNLYKKIPIISAISIAVLSIVWSIVDTSVFLDYSYYSNRIYGYGIMSLPSPILVLIIWWSIGAVLSLLAWFISTLTISATIMKTDATIEINDKLQKQ